jgi:NAD(P)-dependent dehydrogenase (short-subunit alcohol dehydrogenase family)
MEQSLLGLNGKVALVTGAGQGIGRGCALMLAKAGCHIAAVDLDLALAQKTAREVKALGRKAAAIQADVRSEKAIAGMVSGAAKQLGRLDICVNNVGGLVGHRPTPFLKTNRKFYDDIVANNLEATYWCCMAEAKHMTAKKTKGCIINVSSVAGIRATMNIAPYGAAKAGIINLTQVLAWELAPQGIRVNAIAPGTTATERYRDRFVTGGFREVEEANPMKRLAQPEDLGGAAVYLASALASYVTGHTIVVDGGISLATPRPAP